MSSVKALFFIVLMGLSVNVFAGNSEVCLESAMTQLAMNQCAGVGFKDADTELNRVYKKIRLVYKQDEIFLKKLKASQRLWIKLRDADMEMQYPHSNEPGYYGSVYPGCVASFKRQLTLQRVEFLKQWLIGSEEGDVCSGSKLSLPSAIK